MSTLEFVAIGRDRGASRMLQGLGKDAAAAQTRFQKLGQTTSGVGSLTGLVFKAAGVAAVGYGLKVASSNEQARVSFTTMLGSAQKADVFLKQLQKFAATTPFEFPELQTAASSLISAGVNANKVIPIMRTLGDVTSGMGTGAEGVRRATIALQQMNAAGRITAEDLNQLRDAGIPVYELLASATNKSKSEVVALAQAGKLGRKELEQLMSALESGKGLERFNGLMEQQSKTLAGMVSTLRDVGGQTLAGFLEPLFPALKASIGALSDMSSEAKTTFAVIGGGAAVMAITAKGALGLSGAFRTLGLSATAAKVAVGGFGAVLGVAALAFGVFASEHAKSKARVEEFTQALQGEEDAVRKASAAVAAKQLTDAGAFKAAEALGFSMEEVIAAALGQEAALNRIQPLLDGYVRVGVDGSIADQDRASAAGRLSDALKVVGGAHGRATNESKQLSAATAAGEKAMGGMEKKTKSAKEALQQWRAEMFRAARAAIDLEGSQDAVEAAVDDATASVKSNGKTLDSNTEKGRSNRQALRNLASASIAYREKLIEQGASTKRVTGATNDARESFIKTATRMGASRKEANRLADQFGLLDRRIDTISNRHVKIKFTAQSFSIGGVKYRVNTTSPSSVGRSGSRAEMAGHPAIIPPPRGGGAGDPFLRVGVPHNVPKNAMMQPSVINKWTKQYADEGGKLLARAVAKKVEAASSGGLGAGPAAFGAGQAAAIRAGRALGANSVGTYPGHHPSMAKARDFMISSRSEGNRIAGHMWGHASKYGIWYVIWNRRIASRTRPGAGWAPYTRSNPHTDHVHVSWYDKGGDLRPGWTMAYNGTGRNERVVPAGSGATTVVNNYTINATHYSDAQALKTALVNLNRQGALKVIQK